jgi:molybdopterin-guanine dinucleotide biosynthesis protein A
MEQCPKSLISYSPVEKNDLGKPKAVCFITLISTDRSTDRYQQTACPTVTDIVRDLKVGALANVLTVARATVVVCTNIAVVPQSIVTSVDRSSVPESAP